MEFILCQTSKFWNPLKWSKLIALRKVPNSLLAPSQRQPLLPILCKYCPDRLSYCWVWSSQRAWARWSLLLSQRMSHSSCLRHWPQARLSGVTCIPHWQTMASSSASYHLMRQQLPQLRPNWRCMASVMCSFRMRSMIKELKLSLLERKLSKLAALASRIARRTKLQWPHVRMPTHGPTSTVEPTARSTKTPWWLTSQLWRPSLRSSLPMAIASCRASRVTIARVASKRSMKDRWPRKKSRPARLSPAAASATLATLSVVPGAPSVASQLSSLATRCRSSWPIPRRQPRMQVSCRLIKLRWQPLGQVRWCLNCERLEVEMCEHNR